MTGSRAAATVTRPGRPLKEHVTAAVLDAVVGLMAERGVGAVTMDAVAARAQVGKSAIYRRWPTKQDLIIAAAETRFSPLVVPDLGSFRDEMRAMLSARLEVYRTPGMGRFIAGLISAALENDSERRRYAEYTSRLMGANRAILERGIARGEVQPGIDVRAVATLVAAPLVFRLIVEIDLPDTVLVDQVVHLVVQAVGTSS
jgi:AcrR family transcriptional regulator